MLSWASPLHSNKQLDSDADTAVTLVGLMFLHTDTGTATCAPNDTVLCEN